MVFLHIALNSHWRQWIDSAITSALLGVGVGMGQMLTAVNCINAISLFKRELNLGQNSFSLLPALCWLPLTLAGPTVKQTNKKASDLFSCPLS